MLFNSFEFIFIFLPVVLVGFYGLGSVSRTWALRWLIFASLFFYAWWRPLNVLLISPSILINFFLARSLQSQNEKPRPGVPPSVILALGIAFNVAFLGYFKYKNFFLGSVNDVFGTAFVLSHIILPLGISFITFQKIAFLIDVHGKRIESFSLQDYCLFVLFFPQLIAGPIVHYREMMPQFQNARCRFDIGDVSVGLTLFFFGLFKKVCLADGIAPLVSSIYDRASTGEVITLFPAWMAAIGFTLQIYFDFSGYSDMAIGIARFFGIRLPANFNSPLRATNIIDFWLRWHMTLTRFLTAYVYNPLVLVLTRRRLKRGLPIVSGNKTTFGAFLTLLMFPTLLTMLLSGLWHGAGYLFIVWGALHGIYLSINHAWRMLVPRFWKKGGVFLAVTNPLGFVLTFAAVTTAMVFFRSSTLSAATGVVFGMAGLHGVSLPPVIYDHFGPLRSMLHATVESTWGLRDFLSITGWVISLLFIALALPNTLQVLAAYQPALGVTSRSNKNSLLEVLQWRATPAWGIALAIISAITILRLAGPSEFLYWQF